VKTTSLKQMLHRSKPYICKYDVCPTNS